MTVDPLRHLCLVVIGVVEIFNSDGRPLNVIETLEPGPRNVTFGSAEGHVLYVTTLESLHRVRASFGTNIQQSQYISTMYISQSSGQVSRLCSFWSSRLSNQARSVFSARRRMKNALNHGR
jgi:hypothetical protein